MNRSESGVDMPTIDNSIILYQNPDGNTSLEVHLDHETVWLTHAQLAQLFAVNVPAINKRLKNIFKSGELELFPFWKQLPLTAKCIAPGIK